MTHSPPVIFLLLFLWIQHRWVVTSLASVGLAVTYLQRSSIYLILALLAGRMDVEERGRCEARKHSHEPAHITHLWTESEQGMILASFFVGSVIAQIPGAMLAMRFGAKTIFGVSILLSSLCSVLMPLALREKSVWYVILVRFSQGLVQGPLHPSIRIIGVYWSPREELCFLNACMLTGTAVGQFLAFLIPGLLIEEEWKINQVFYVVSAVGLVWAVPWWLLVSTSPLDNRFVSHREKKYIFRSLAYDYKCRGMDADIQGLLRTGLKPMKLEEIKWIPMLTSSQIIILVLANFGFNWGYLMLSMELPFYITDALNLPMHQVSVMSAVPWSGAILSTILYGAQVHLFFTQKLYRPVTMRRKMGILSCPLTALCMLGASQIHCAEVLACMFFSVAAFYSGAAASGIQLSASQLTPGLVGIVTAIVNTIADLAGVIIPLVIHQPYTQIDTMNEWTKYFTATVLIMTVLSLPYILFTNTNIQLWSTMRHQKSNIAISMGS